MIDPVRGIETNFLAPSSEFHSQAVKAHGQQVEDHLFKPLQPPPKKKDRFVHFRGIYMGIYILVSTGKLKRCDFDFYNVLTF